jgi:hypothetical protein
MELLSDFVQIALSNAQNVENALEWPFDIMKHCFFDFTKVVFQDVQEADYEFSRQFAYLKQNFDEVAFLCPVCRK